MSKRQRKRSVFVVLLVFSFFFGGDLVFDNDLET
jgi:hypothetical protein